VKADDLTIQLVSPTYQTILAGRDVTGLPLSEVFSGHDLDKLVNLLKTAVRNGQTIHSNAIEAVIPEACNGLTRMVHTAVPILDESGVNVNRLFIYSEKPE
jgi:hypothetical protein